MTVLNEQAKEAGLYIVETNFLDPDGAGFTPKSCAWSLTNEGGEIINARDRINALVVSSVHNFVLSGDDLIYTEGAVRETRVLTIEGTFDSIYGLSLPFREECKFKIEHMTIPPA